MKSQNCSHSIKLEELTFQMSEEWNVDKQPEMKHDRGTKLCYGYKSTR